jgi:hypothetical protein
MLPPDAYETALHRINAELADGRADPEATLDSTPVRLSQFVRIRKVLEQVDARDAVLADFGLDSGQWERAQQAWGPLLYVVELAARYGYWQTRLDVSADVTRISAPAQQGDSLP